MNFVYSFVLIVLVFLIWFTTVFIIAIIRATQMVACGAQKQSIETANTDYSLHVLISSKIIALYHSDHNLHVHTWDTFF